LKKQFIVFDDLLPPTFQDHLESIFYHQMQGPIWSFGSKTSGGGEEKDFKSFVKEFEVIEGPQLICLAFSDDQIAHQTWFDLRPILWFLELKIPGTEIKDIKRCKVNLNPLNETWKNKINTPHADVTESTGNFYSLIYYVKDADGDTVVFDQFYNDFRRNHCSLNVLGSISPKKGRAVLLPSTLLHSGTNPIVNDCRIVANFVFETERLINFDLRS
jgi:hypothetical protein